MASLLRTFFLVSAFCALWARGDMVLATRTLRLELAGGAVASLRHLPEGRELVPADRRMAIATATVGGKRYEATMSALAADGLVLGFGDSGTSLVLRLEPADDWLRFTLVAIRGERPTAVELLRVPVAFEATVGRVLGLARDERTALCVMAASEGTDAGARGGGKPYLAATTQDAPGPKLEGSSAALILCAPEEFAAVARRAAHAFGLPTNETPAGVPVKETEAVRGSYYFIGFGEKDVDRMIDYCRQAGIRQVLLSSTAWCTKVGHYELNARNFPDGIEGLKRTVDRLHEAGILVGMHCFASKISKTDPYVTPVPDRRFWVDLETRLAAPVGPEQTEIRVDGDLRDWPGSAPAATRYWEGGVDKHREVILGDEIVQYRSIGPEGVWNTFLGCTRGAWGTRPAAHAAGTPGRHYGVDGCINGYIIDQETTLLDEAQDRLAAIFNACGFDMVYFDGGEDVDRRRFSHYVSKFQENAMGKFARRPVVHMGTILTHRLWHSFARSATVDTYLNTLSGAIVGGKPPEKWPTVEEHIDRSVAYLLRRRTDLMPGELGWFGVWGRRAFHGQEVEGLQLDELEYLLAKSLAHDAPVSLQTGFADLESHPLAPEILRIFRAYEELRLARAIPPEQTAPLAEKGAHFALLREGGRPRFARLGERFHPGGNPDVFARVGADGDGAVATVWHAVRDGHLALGGPLRASDFAGQAVPVAIRDGQAVVPLDTRRLTVFADLPPADLRARLEAAEATTRPPAMVLVRPEQAARLVGSMRLGSQAGVREAEAHGDVLVCPGQANYREIHDWYAEYEVAIPRSGLWTVWGRVRYPTGTDQSFGFVPAGETPTLQGAQVLGNCGRNDRKWHWTGTGGGSSTLPPGKPIRLRLEGGPFSFRVYGRESTDDPQTTPRLDLLLLVEGDSLVPTDDLLPALLNPAP